jgi:hypothetical protein
VRAPPELVELQGFLAGALRREEDIEADAAVAAAARVHVAGNDRVPPEEQVDIYRRQFWLRHHEALEQDYPGLRRLVGEEAFDALVHAYLTAHPPRTPSLRELGADIVAFAEGWGGFPEGLRAPAIELLRYEHAFIDLFDGAALPALDAGKIASLPEDAWERARVVIHPHLARFRFEHAVHRYRLAALSDEGDPPAPARQPVCLVLYRRDLEICFDEVDPAALALLDALAAGDPLVPACDRVAAALDPAQAEAMSSQVGAWFQRWAALGWIIDVTLGG